MTDPKMPPSVSVKPLVWHKSHITPWNGDWHTVPTGYTVRCADENWWTWANSCGFGCSSSDTGAKAAAQADYEARILSALEVVEDDAGRYVPRHVPSGMPTDCCKFGVIDMNKGGIEVCRCWTAEDATLISAALTKGSTDDRT